MAAVLCIAYHLAVVLLGSSVNGEDGGIEVAGIHPLHQNDSHPAPAADYKVEEKPVEPVKNSMGIPDFSLVENNRVCLRASFESKIIINYRTVGTAQSPTRVLETETAVPKDAGVSGSCGDIAQLTLSWEEYTLTLSFTTQTVEDTKLAGPMKTWFAQNISMTINTTSPHFHTPKQGGIHEVMSSGEARFNTPANFSFSCLSEQSVEMRERNTTERDATISGVTFSLWSTQIQAYDLNADGEFKQSAKCALDMSITTANTVPIAVAVCLAILILIVVIVYFAMRHQSKQHYRGLE